MPWGRITEHHDGRVTWAWGTVKPRVVIEQGEAVGMEVARRQYLASRARGKETPVDAAPEEP
jgi:hypothetical protein